MDEWHCAGREVGGGMGEKASARASVSEDRLMWVSERSSRLFDSQLSDRPGGPAVQQRQQSPRTCWAQPLPWSLGGKVRN